MPAAEHLEPVHLAGPAVRIQRWTWRLVLAATSAGAVGAFAAALVRLGFRGLQWLFTGSEADAPTAAAHLHLWRRALTPVLGALVASAVLWVQKRKARRPGREPRPYIEYVEAVRHRRGSIPLAANCWRTLSAAFSVATGAAVGREGSMIQIAASITSALWRGKANRHRPAPLAFVVACGVAGGVTAAYNSPVAAVFFAAEIVLGAFEMREIPLLALAAGAGWLVSGTMLGRERLYPVHGAFRWSWTLALLPAFAVVLGLIGPLYQRLLVLGRAARRLPLPLLWSGAVVGCCSLADPRVWGNGDAGLTGALGRSTLAAIPLSVPSLIRVLALRLVSTLVCVWTGTVGGVFTPTLFLGGALGALFGHLAPDANPVLWAIAGMSCLMAAATHAPWMAAFMAAELTGEWALVPLLIPLNFLARGVARRLSPRALYAIASQAPSEARRQYRQPKPTEAPPTEPVQ